MTIVRVIRYQRLGSLVPTDPYWNWVRVWFAYDQDVIAAIKQVPFKLREWLPDEKVWLLSPAAFQAFEVACADTDWLLHEERSPVGTPEPVKPVEMLVEDLGLPPAPPEEDAFGIPIDPDRLDLDRLEAELRGTNIGVFYPEVVRKLVARIRQLEGANELLVRMHPDPETVKRAWVKELREKFYRDRDGWSTGLFQELEAYHDQEALERLFEAIGPRQNEMPPGPPRGKDGRPLWDEFGTGNLEP